MFFPQSCWWDDCHWAVPEGVKYLCERWWEFLRDWWCITTYSPTCSYVLSVLEDVADVIDDLQEGRLRSSHQLDSLREEVVEILRTDPLLSQAFSPEILSTISYFDDLYKNLPSEPQARYAELKNRKAQCRRAASAARRLHHRCLRRRTSDADMTWPGIGGMIGAELLQAVEAQPANFARIDRLATALLLDCLYRGYNLGYLTTLFDRYLPDANGLRPAFLHVFRRLYSLMAHRYGIYFVVRGATGVTISSGESNIKTVALSDIRAFADASGPNEVHLIDDFLAQQHPAPSALVRVDCEHGPDAAAAADAARKQLQEIVDYWDFQAPSQSFELAPLALVTWKDRDGLAYCTRHPDTSREQPARQAFSIDIDADWAGQIVDLTEALRWSAVARRERTPEVALLATWFGFEFLAGNIAKTPVEGIMEFFPKTLAIGNLRRRLTYWWRSLQAHPRFREHEAHDRLDQMTTFHGGTLNIAGIAALLASVIDANPTVDAKAVIEIASGSVLLRERTFAEARLFSNSQHIAQVMREDAKEIQRELQRYLMIRNKLVHRARIDHPLLVVVSDRARARLYDLLRDLSSQLMSRRLDRSVGAVLGDYRDTFDELLTDLGSAHTVPGNFINRIMLS